MGFSRSQCEWAAIVHAGAYPRTAQQGLKCDSNPAKRPPMRVFMAALVCGVSALFLARQTYCILAKHGQKMAFVCKNG